MSVLVYQQRVIGGGGGGSSSPGGSVITISTEDEELFGQTVTLSKGTYTKSAVFSNEGVAVITGFEKTGTINVTVGEITKTMDIPYYGEYAVEVYGKAFYKAWLKSINHSTEGYESLNDVLADEKLLRELFTRHASVDFLVDNSDAEELSTIINNDYCAKWINLRDYALDTLYANETIAALMDTADKYFYGEWVITDSTTTPVTWGPKGNVPVMTSNTAPYGEAITSGLTSSSDLPSAYKLFDKVREYGNNWGPTVSGSPTFGYHFVNPVCVKKAYMYTGVTVNTAYTYKFQASNDGTNWVDLSDQVQVPVGTVGIDEYYNIDNDEYYLYYRMWFSNANYSNRFYIRGLQFYGRELKVSPPVMTSDTEPWGEAYSYPGPNGNLEAYAVWHAFNKTVEEATSIDAGGGNTGTSSLQGHSGYFAYHFNSKSVIKMARYGNRKMSWIDQCPKKFKYQYSNDNKETWYDLTDELDGSNIELKIISTYFLENIEMSDIRLYVSQTQGTKYNETAIAGLDFYGLDYSEYDWDLDNPRHYIYDHGVQLETLALTGSATEESSALKLIATNDQASITIDTTDYVLLRGTEGQYGSGTNALICGSGSSNFGSTAGNLPYNHYLDITSINGNNATGIKQTAAGTFTCEEIWLE